MAKRTTAFHHYGIPPLRPTLLPFREQEVSEVVGFKLV
jgi:hypothetical protein